MDEFKAFFEGIAVPLLLSMFGGVAKTLREGARSWRQFATNLIVSGFAGVIVHLLLQDVEMSASIKAALVGLSGYSSAMILDALTARFTRGIEQIPVPGAFSVWDGVTERRQGERKDGNQ